LWTQRIPVIPRPGSDALRKTDKILAREIWNPLAAGIHDEPTRRPRCPGDRMSRAVLSLGSAGRALHEHGFTAEDRMMATTGFNPLIGFPRFDPLEVDVPTAMQKLQCSYAVSLIAPKPFRGWPHRHCTLFGFGHPNHIC